MMLPKAASTSSLTSHMSPLFRCSTLNTSTGQFVDEAERTRRVEYEAQSHNNTVQLHISFSQIDAYSPSEDRVYVNEADNMFAVFDGHGGGILLDLIKIFMFIVYCLREPVLSALFPLQT